jgi:hypothetical protein
MRSLFTTLTDALHTNAATRDALAVVAGIAAWLLAVGAAWQILLPHMCATNAGTLAVLLALAPALTTWAAVMVITHTKNWY